MEEKGESCTGSHSFCPEGGETANSPPSLWKEKKASLSVQSSRGNQKGKRTQRGSPGLGSWPNQPSALNTSLQTHTCQIMRQAYDTWPWTLLQLVQGQLKPSEGQKQDFNQDVLTPKPWFFPSTLPIFPTEQEVHRPRSAQWLITETQDVWCACPQSSFPVCGCPSLPAAGSKTEPLFLFWNCILPSLCPYPGQSQRSNKHAPIYAIFS